VTTLEIGTPFGIAHAHVRQADESRAVLVLGHDPSAIRLERYGNSEEPK